LPQASQQESAAVPHLRSGWGRIYAFQAYPDRLELTAKISQEECLTGSRYDYLFPSMILYCSVWNFICAGHRSLERRRERPQSELFRPM